MTRNRRHSRTNAAILFAAALAGVLAAPPARAQETEPSKSFVRLESLAAPAGGSDSGPAKSESARAAAKTAEADRLDRERGAAHRPTASGSKTSVSTPSGDADNSAVRQARRDLRRASSSPPPEAEKSFDLQKRLDELQALQPVRRQAKAPDVPLVTLLPEHTTSAILQPPTSQPATTSQPAPPRPAVNPAMLERLTKDPARGLPLADALFRDGHIEPARAIYQAALEANLPAAQKDWVLFQAANCQRDREAQSAIELYQKLVKDYPASRWAVVGTAQIQWIEWKQAHLAPASRPADETAKGASPTPPAPLAKGT
jgi:hypothetical protein